MSYFTVLSLSLPPSLFLSPPLSFSLSLPPIPSGSPQMILTVYLSKGEQPVAEVPVTPETTCRDVVDVCRAPGEGSCHLAEVWRGNGKRGERNGSSQHMGAHCCHLEAGCRSLLEP